MTFVEPRPPDTSGGGFKRRPGRRHRAQAWVDRRSGRTGGETGTPAVELGVRVLVAARGPLARLTAAWLVEIDGVAHRITSTVRTGEGLRMWTLLAVGETPA